jgi:hypothetical protein
MRINGRPQHQQWQQAKTVCRHNSFQRSAIRLTSAKDSTVNICDGATQSCFRRTGMVASGPDWYSCGPFRIFGSVIVTGTFALAIWLVWLAFFLQTTQPIPAIKQ